MEHLLLLLLLPWSSVGRILPDGRCETAKADIVVLLDQSGSISPRGFEDMKTFVAECVNMFNIGPVQIGLTKYNGSPEIEWHLNRHQEKRSLLQAINQLKRMGGSTYTGAALKHILRYSFTPTVGMRTDSKKIAVLITDGESMDDMVRPVQHLVDSGIELHLLGVRDFFMRHPISREVHMSFYSTFKRLLSSTKGILSRLCDSARNFDSVRLLNGSSLCSGTLQVRSKHTWASVCDADFDQQDAEVACRELGCGPPVLQGALHGDEEAPVWTEEFQCGGHESALLDSNRSSCSPGRAAGLTCSEPLKLVGGASRCEGELELKGRTWRPVEGLEWTVEEAAAACRELDCGSVVSTGSRNEAPVRLVWKVRPGCVKAAAALRGCAMSSESSSIVELICSDLLVQPILWVSSSISGGSQQGSAGVFQGSSFTISCSIQPQYPGGSFQLTFTSSHTTRNYTQPAVNHAAHFLFPAAEPAHQGSYSCIYHVYIFSHNFSSESRGLPLTVSAFIIRLAVLLLALLVFISLICYAHKAPRKLEKAPPGGWKRPPQEAGKGPPGGWKRPPQEAGKGPPRRLEKGPPGAWKRAPRRASRWTFLSQK